MYYNLIEEIEVNEMNRKIKYVKIGVIVFFLVAFLYLMLKLNIFDKDNIVKLFSQKNNGLSYDIFFIIVSAILLVFFVPLSWISLASAIFFGLKGIVLITIAGLISGIISFSIARIFKEDVSSFVERQYNKKDRKISLQEIYSKISNYGFGYVLFIRSMPFIPFSILNYIFGISFISFRDFLLSTFISVAVGQSINVYFFYKAMNIGDSPLDTFIAAALKVIYFFAIIFWERKSKYSTKE